MSNSLEMLKAEILRLSLAERARELDAGLVKAVPLEDVIARLEARYPDEGQASSAS